MIFVSIKGDKRLVLKVLSAHGIMSSLIKPLTGRQWERPRVAVGLPVFREITHALDAKPVGEYSVLCHNRDRDALIKWYAEPLRYGAYHNGIQSGCIMAYYDLDALVLTGQRRSHWPAEPKSAVTRRARQQHIIIRKGH